MIKKYKYKYK